MFEPFLINAWIAGTLVGIIAGVVGFFVVLRGDSFLAHAVPHGAFAGAAAAVLVGANPLLGLGVAATAGAMTISALGARARRDVATALGLVLMLGLGEFFLSRGDQYSSQVYALLFGQILGVSTIAIVPMVVLGALCVLTVAVVYRPLLLGSVLPDMAAGHGVDTRYTSMAFALVLACATTMSVPIVGALLMFALLVGPAATARCFTRSPGRSIAASVVLSVGAVWAAIALSVQTDWPIGFFVTAICAAMYIVGRAASVVSARRVGRAVRKPDRPLRTSRRYSTATP
ncbi:metal ABC transporter permease [Gordonia sp. L191]|uniref:metal ABC transporter permease n=1 Tax=Gordonia sp. L191 TaxID=2982699 RepID=UPI0024BF6F9D|nr:metal ABC transporter permease [Gordonia sp. L191]WHU47489.1 metal ABC transporter permease [Gordonia sp. L191]